MIEKQSLERERQIITNLVVELECRLKMLRYRLKELDEGSSL